MTITDTEPDMKAPGTESASDRARRLWDGSSFTETARELLRELLYAVRDDDLGSEDAVEILLPWITDRVRATIRASVREAEEAAWTSPSGRPHRSATSIRANTGALPALDNLDMLLSLPVLVPRAGSETQTVRWREMTIEDHEARIGMLRRPMGATLDAMKRHQWSIQEIRRYGVSCLGEIDATVLKDDMVKHPWKDIAVT